MIPNKLTFGDEIRVVAPSRSQSIVWDNVHNSAVEYFENAGFHLSYSAHSRELDKYLSSSTFPLMSDKHINLKLFFGGKSYEINQ